MEVYSFAILVAINGSLAGSKHCFRWWDQVWEYHCVQRICRIFCEVFYGQWVAEGIRSSRGKLEKTMRGDLIHCQALDDSVFELSYLLNYCMFDHYTTRKGNIMICSKKFCTRLFVRYMVGEAKKQPTCLPASQRNSLKMHHWIQLFFQLAEENRPNLTSSQRRKLPRMTSSQFISLHPVHFYSWNPSSPCVGNTKRHCSLMQWRISIGHFWARTRTMSSTGIWMICWGYWDHG